MDIDENDDEYVARIEINVEGDAVPDASYNDDESGSNNFNDDQYGNKIDTNLFKR